MLKLQVTNQEVSLVERNEYGEILVGSSKGEYICQFNFDESWDGFVKTAVFVNEITELNDKRQKVIRDSRLILDNSCVIPETVLRNDSYLKIAVCGVKDEISRPTIFTPCMYVREGGCDVETLPDPDPFVYLQIIEIMEATKEIAQSVRNDADTGKFDGKDGVGVPEGGLKGQILSKKSNANYDFLWMDDKDFFTGVSSWNSRKGSVIPQKGDYNVEQIEGLQDELKKAKIGSTYSFKQRTSSDIWTIQHNLNKHPSVTIADSAGTMVIGEVTYQDENNLTIKFANAFSGIAYLN